ncbi:hypothetical protein TNCV_4543881 [Trichonephila clavipes]|nr:hypothetical protein TNCV_4543881 [Trichonephila clavipes]
MEAMKSIPFVSLTQTYLSIRYPMTWQIQFDSDKEAFHKLFRTTNYILPKRSAIESFMALSSQVNPLAKIPSLCPWPCCRNGSLIKKEVTESGLGVLSEAFCTPHLAHYLSLRK